MDSIDALALDRTRQYAGWAAYDAKHLLYWAERIKTKRSFLTEMETELKTAEKSLVEALEAVRKAKARYDELART